MILKKHQIIVIGTNPPCPRCQLLKNILAAKIGELRLFATLHSLCFASEEAKAIAKEHGLIPGTANTVSTVLSLPLDLDAFSELEKRYRPDPDSPYAPYNDCRWSASMDELVRPFETAAKDAGILMTPVLIINGQIKHQGSVPDLSRINTWLNELR